MSTTLTRDELYELVWSKPMTQLAKEFALSDVALHKVCRKHGIPNPPMGWWAKKAAGKPVKRIPLPRSASGDADRAITIAAGHLKREPAAVAAARERARVLASSIDFQSGSPSHPVVVETMRALRQAGPPSQQGLVSVSGAGRVKSDVSAASFDRVELILGRLAAAGDALDVELGADEMGACLTYGEDSIRFSISESFRRHRHVLTETEQAQSAAWEKRHDKVLRRGGWDVLGLPDRPRFPEWDYVPTGQLSFEMQAPYLYGSSPRRSSRDAKIQRLEKMAVDILVGVHVLAAALGEDRSRREAAEKQRRETEARRERALRGRHVRERRNAALDGLLQEIGELDRLRRLVVALQAEMGHQPPGRVGAFMEFAQSRLSASEQALQAEGLSTRFETERLFGDDDDYNFRSPIHGY